MPYIPQSERPQFNKLTDQMVETVVDGESCTPGQLNYLMTKLALAYLQRKGKSYGTIAEIMSAFACAAAEFYRRKVADYEDEKVIENGDVY